MGYTQTHTHITHTHMCVCVCVFDLKLPHLLQRADFVQKFGSIPTNTVCDRRTAMCGGVGVQLPWVDRVYCSRCLPLFMARNRVYVPWLPCFVVSSNQSVTYCSTFRVFPVAAAAAVPFVAFGIIMTSIGRPLHYGRPGECGNHTWYVLNIEW